ncbi:hypothetical protein HYC85_000378 [Camellia sinensis]|uniref:Protein kinase domain-containing protein n=1 Tax=Camellia sinensis TaxID=4442 RepID=A0A7J7I2L0_CAMSI|nr:hypothetical protein HYC85_000378 [Camellia sinensis]
MVGIAGGPSLRQIDSGVIPWTTDNGVSLWSGFPLHHTIGPGGTLNRDIMTDLSLGKKHHHDRDGRTVKSRRTTTDPSEYLTESQLDWAHACLRTLMSIIFLLFLSLQLHLSPLSSSSTTASAARHLHATASSRPLDFDVLRRLIQSSNCPKLDSDSVFCHYIKAGLRLVQSDYLRTTNNFLSSIDSAESCWVSYQTLINDFFPNFNDIHKICGFPTSWIAEGCMNITTRDEFEGNVSKSALDDAVKACNQSLCNGSPCASCTTSLSSLQPSNLNGQSIGNLSDCTAYPSIYAAVFINRFGPTDEGTANCLFGFDFSDLSNSNGKVRTIVICVVVIGCEFVLFLGCGGFWILRRKREKIRERSKVDHERETNLAFRMNSINESTILVRYTFDEIREATKNFSRLNIIGRGGYGNVYKGVLLDGSEVALKRFKNCSVGGDAVFAHEVEVIASVRHVNLVALRGFFYEINKRKSTKGGILTLSSKAGEEEREREMGSERMSDSTDNTSFQPSETKLCPNGCGFFGAVATMNLCSECYRDFRITEEHAA